MEKVRKKKVKMLLLLTELVLFVSFFEHGTAKSTTDPIEVNALNSIFTSWKISSSMSALSWNNTDDPCSGYAILPDTTSFEDSLRFNPAILCDCSYNNSSTCHIIRLRATQLNISGRIPDELRHLTKLDNLQIADNYLYGPLPAFFGNLTAMKYLSIGKNLLSGSLPKELGNLKDLISLGIGMNNFSGPLPPELGNMTNLEQMYIDSIGVSGEIPSTFENFQKIKTLWASDNNFGGKVPEFLGNFTKLTTLRLQGNSFQGPIPSSFANLTSLSELRLGDLSCETSTLAFIRNMKSMSTLILRDSKISDTIPSYFEEFVELTHLDLSFNHLTGRIPPSFFNIEKLQYLYLGNNSLSGELPIQKSVTLQNIDLSYNELYGSIPTWAAEENLQLNLVANNFTADSSNINFLKGLECLQRNIPCYRGKPRYYNFAINCGGNTVVSDSMDYEADNQNLKTASYYVNDAKRWGVSSTGRFIESQNPRYVEIGPSPSNINGTSDAQLFQSARISPSSLRYYGLGLENGQYKVKLQFSDTLFLKNPNLDKTSFRRIFDIYIQGNRVAKDFDIRKEGGAFPFRAIINEYTTNVTDNFMEIHFFWAGKGTCCLPEQGYYGSLISAISVTPEFKPTVSNRPPDDSNNKKTIALITGIVAGVIALLSLCVFGAFIYRRKKHLADDEETYGLAELPNSFSYSELKSATRDFDPANKLGEGGFGAVYKGVLRDETIIAVKQLSKASLQGKKQFVTEVGTISAVKHRNLVNLKGFCYEGDKRLLVYEYLEHRSLDRALFGKSSLKLDWPTRFQICLGTAKGLAYIHEESRIRMIHRDIKTSNILLDDDLNPKISDFGLARLYADNLTHISTGVAGTVGYLAPEYAMRGHLTEKVDVFGFGVVSLEILSGRPNTDTNLTENKVYLLEWVWYLHERKCELEMMDPSLSSFDREEALRVLNIAFLCTQANPMLRPSMSRVVSMLIGDTEITAAPMKPTYLTDCHFDDISNQQTYSESFQSQMPLPSGPTLLANEGR